MDTSTHIRLAGGTSLCYLTSPEIPLLILVLKSTLGLHAQATFEKVLASYISFVTDLHADSVALLLQQITSSQPI